MAERLSAVAGAIADGADIVGHLHRFAIDNYECGSYPPHLGLVSMDRTAFAHTPKPSALFYRDVIRRHLSELPSRRLSNL